MDNQRVTLRDKVKYHQHCGDWCGFIKWHSTDQPLEDYKKLTTKDKKGKEIPWTGGVYPKMEKDFPHAFKELEAIFDNLGNPELMARTLTMATQNSNESVHLKVWNYCRKGKKNIL